jgi:hypothetical protein
MPGWTPPPPASRRSAAVPRRGLELLQVVWDEAAGVTFVTHPQGLLLETAEEIEHWRQEVFTKLAAVEQQRGGRFPIVISLDGVTIRPSVAELYGGVVKNYVERFASGLARYTRRPNGVGQVVTVTAMKEGFKANLFTSRSEAIAHALSGAEGATPSRPRSF